MNKSTQVNDFAAFAGDEVTRETLRRAARDGGYSSERVFDGGIEAAIETLADAETPGLLVADIDGAADALAAVVALAGVCDPDTRLIVLGERNDLRLYRALLDLGAEDYLLKPVNGETLLAAMRGAGRNPGAPGPMDGERSGRFLAVIGVRGGVGASMVALNMAWVLAQQPRKRVVLVDLDLYFGTQLLALDLEPGKGFREALEKPERIDGLFVERAVVPAGDGLFVLGAEEQLEKRLSFDPDALERLLEELGREFDHVVVDLPRFAARSQLARFDAALDIVLVADASLAAMRDSSRLAAMARGTVPGAPVHLLLNRIGADKLGELSEAEFEKGAGLGVAQKLPFEPKAMAASAGAAKPLGQVARASRVVAGLRRLVRDMDPVDASRPIDAGWRRFFNLRRTA